MSPHTLCIIEPATDALPEEVEQLGGILVTTHATADLGGYWDVLPVAVMRYRQPTKSVRGTVIAAGEPVEILIPVDWLKPIRGLPISEPTATPVESEA